MTSPAFVTCYKNSNSYSPRLPARPHENPSDLTDISNESSVDRVFDLTVPQRVNRIAYPPTTDDEYDAAFDNHQRYLWVLREEGFFIVDENDRDLVERFSLVRNDVSHTNLTGGEECYCGGEVYFLEDNRIFVTGGSGRYPPTKVMLEDLRKCLISFGCNVVISEYQSNNITCVRLFARGL